MNKKYLNLLGMIALFIFIILAYNFFNSKTVSIIAKGGNPGVWFALAIPTVFGLVVMPFKIISEIRKVFNLKRTQDLIIKSDTLEITITLIYTLLFFILLEVFDYPFKISWIFNMIFN